MVAMNPTPGNEDRLMSAREVAAFLGYAVQTIYNKASRNQIPHVKLGTTLRFRRSEIELWIIEQTAAADEAGKADAAEQAA
jgi:excisionase family DNA binding protein